MVASRAMSLQVAVGRPGLDVAASLAAGAGGGALARRAAGQPVHGRLDAARSKDLADGHDQVHLLGAADAHRIGDVAFQGRAGAAGVDLAGLGGLFVTR